MTKEGLIEAEGLFRKALELDPQLARAYAGLAEVYSYSIDLGLAPSVEEALSKMMEAGEKAVQLDPNDGKRTWLSASPTHVTGNRSKLLPSFTGLKLLRRPMQTCSS